MKTQAGYVQGYNAQAVVTEDQIIVAAEVTQEENDMKQLHPMLKRAQANLKAIAYLQAVGTALADAGYCSEANLLAADPAGPALLMAPNKDWKQRRRCGNSHRHAAALEGADGPRRMERMLLTTRGRRLYKKRGQTVEPVFGQIKSARGCDGFMRRGTAACDSEWKLLCATHNLLKLWRNGKRAVPLDARAATTAVWLGKRKEEQGMTLSKIPRPLTVSARKDSTWRTSKPVLGTDSSIRGATGINRLFNFPHQ